jgi:hypothetical protein
VSAGAAARVASVGRRALLAGRRCVAACTLIGLVVGCRASAGTTALTAGSEPTPAESAWPAVLIAAQSDVDQGRHGDADKALREFAAEYERSQEALESSYWRAVFMLDPANTTASARDAAAVLDRYLATNGPLAHRSEATVLQRIAKNLAAPREPSTPVRAPDPTREAELKALKDELEATKAELERIKKRVAPPPPTTTPPPSRSPDAK